MFIIEDGPPDGPPILLIHGFASSHHAWDRVVPLLADDFRVIRVDLLGHGHTGGPAADAAAQAAAVRRELGGRALTAVTVVGHSFGADVAVALAGEPWAARVVVVTQGPDYSGARVPRLRWLTDRSAHALFRALGPVLAVTDRMLRRSRRPLAALVGGVCRDVRSTDPGMLRLVLTDRRRTLAGRPLDVGLAAVDVPALVVLGGRDRLYGDRSAARYRAAGARVEVVPDGTHALPQQHPATLAALLRTSVAGPRGRRPQ